MTGHTDAEQILDAFLAPEADRLPDRVMDAALSEIARTPQRRALSVPWRFPMTSALNRATALAAVVLVAVVGTGGALYLAGVGNGGAGGPPTPSPTSIPSPKTVLPTYLPPLDTTGWTSFTSSRYAYRIAYPPTGWTPIPGDHDWTMENDIDAFNSTAPDRFETQGAGDALGIRLSIWTDDLDPGTTQQDWISAYCTAAYGSGPCTESRNLLSEVMWGGPARILGWNNPRGEPMAAFVHDQTIYVMAIWRSENDPSVRSWGGSQRLLEAFITSMTMPWAPRWESPVAP